ncbi:MAG: hypothetical protein R3F37_03805 [Candidatus Competibacteraceae bacterium]
MTQSITSNATIQDHDLLDWLASDNASPRDLIVELKLPKRLVVFQRDVAGRQTPNAIRNSTPNERDERLSELNRYLHDDLKLPTHVLRAAGAIAVSANKEKVKEILDHPLVKAIRSNRRLRMRINS